MMNKKSQKKLWQMISIILAIVIIAVIVTFTWLINRGQSPKTSNQSLIATAAQTTKLQVTASFYPLYYFATQIGGDKADVINITPAGSEPHDYEPTAQDMVKIETSNLVILNGLGLESWGDNVKKNIDSKKTYLTIASDGVASKTLAENGQNTTDPHIWLSPELAKTIVNNITIGFIKADPDNNQYYQDQATILKTKLDELDATYHASLANCRLKDIVTSHAAFGYLASTYKLNQIAIAGLSPDAEPSPAQLANIISKAKTDKIKYIFFESLISPKLSQTIATEINAQTLVFNPLEGLTKDELSSGQDYFTEMQNNLTNLQTALECQK
jgi:zinc transport system substrate-binding protein